LKGEADGRSGAERRRQGRGWTSRGGYPNPVRDTPRGREAPRYAGPPFRHASYGTKAQGRKHRPTGRPSGRRDGAGVSRWTSVGERKRKGGRRPEQSGSAGLVPREPDGRRNAVRVGCNPCVPEWSGVCVPGAPRNSRRGPFERGDPLARVAPPLTTPKCRHGSTPLSFVRLRWGPGQVQACFGPSK